MELIQKFRDIEKDITSALAIMQAENNQLQQQVVDLKRQLETPSLPESDHGMSLEGTVRPHNMTASDSLYVLNRVYDWLRFCEKPIPNIAGMSPNYLKYALEYALKGKIQKSEWEQMGT